MLKIKSSYKTLIVMRIPELKLVDYLPSKIPHGANPQT